MNEKTPKDEIRTWIEDRQIEHRESLDPPLPPLLLSYSRALAALESLWGTHCCFLENRGLYDAAHMAHEHILRILRGEQQEIDDGK